ncbi:Cysteine/Histidine-rich C1 domain family protein [Gossypium australe]|uniref:Cysteine/Histidine-rich C1 domain family protein n=1 Tax=Gossypium australe TaxID=47621 RepID=A0A5B6WZJ6_9ROSI|nr:Cysteine/Histidine-rich C1 domain family protein [Gossypium australe]
MSLVLNTNIIDMNLFLLISLSKTFLTNIIVICVNKKEYHNILFVAHIGCALTKIKDDHGSTSSLVGGKGISIGKLMEQDERNAESKLEYFDHEHPLCFKKVIGQNESAICKACFLEISDEAYACKSCEYYIHKTCTNLPSELEERVSHAKDVETLLKGLLTHALCCDFMLDVKCALLRVPKIETQRLKETEERRSKSCLFNKTHQLSFFNIKAVLDECCSFCQRYLKGPTYACSDYLSWPFPREMKLQFHPLHPFHSLLDNSGKVCHVCKKEILYDIYYSRVQCDLHLHASCANSLKRVLKSTSHIHNLYYFGPNIRAEGFKYEMQKCGKCRKMLRSNPLNFCMECDTKLHVECALPPSLKSKYHLHPCTLKPGFMEDDSGQNYCDILALLSLVLWKMIQNKITVTFVKKKEI